MTSNGGSSLAGANANGGKAGNGNSAGSGTSGTSVSGGNAAVGGQAGAGAGEGGVTNAEAGQGTGGASGGESGAATGGAGGDAAGATNEAGAAGAASTPTCPVTTDKTIFVSSAVYTGALGGFAGANDKCQKLAEAAGLCGSYKAWLGNDTDTPIDLFTHPTGNYVLPSGEIVASGYAGLTSGTLKHAINVTENKMPAPQGTVRCGGNPSSPVWTDVMANGNVAMSGSCSNWSSSSTGPAGVFGDANSTTASWTAMCQLLTVCADSAALYCVEQ
jgi:hypothetical protein